MCEIAAKIRKKYVIGQYSYYSLAYSNLIYFTIYFIVVKWCRGLVDNAAGDVHLIGMNFVGSCYTSFLYISLFGYAF